MIASTYAKMLQEKSVIRELFGYALDRAKEIGYENVFDYSLGNPSVEPPREFTESLIRLLQEESPMKLHGYSPTLGIPSVLKKVAQSLQERFKLPYLAEHIFMTTGAAGAIAHAIRAVVTPGDGRTGVAVPIIGVEVVLGFVGIRVAETFLVGATVKLLVGEINSFWVGVGVDALVGTLVGFTHR